MFPSIAFSFSILSGLYREERRGEEMSPAVWDRPSSGTDTVLTELT
jgi:hypothetical protein